MIAASQPGSGTVRRPAPLFGYEWVGLGYDDKIMTGYNTLGKSTEAAEQTMTQLTAEGSVA